MRIARPEKRKKLMTNENQKPQYHNNNILGVLQGLLIGSLAGAVAMLLMAPQSGEKTRKRIQEKGIELRDRTTEMIDDVMTQVRSDSKKITEGGRQKAKELMHQGQELVVEQLEHVTDAAKASKKAIQSL
jgi:gas vesicle protein